MKLCFSSNARRQIEAVLDHIAEASPSGALRVRDRIIEITSLSKNHPLAGQTTSRAGVRRVVLNPFPYLLFYRVMRDEIVVLRFRHGARRDVDR